jgi:site-specific DNA-methyltransferase (adenine-specific)
MPWTIPTGMNAASAIIKGRCPLVAQKTIEVSDAEYPTASTTMIAAAVVRSIGPLAFRVIGCSHGIQSIRMGIYPCDCNRNTPKVLRELTQFRVARSRHNSYLNISNHKRDECVRKNLSLHAERDAICKELKAAQAAEMTMYRHLRNAGEHWIAVKAELGDRRLNISQWARENLPIGRQWMDRHSELFKRWAEFVEAKKWADSLSYSADRRPSLQLAFDIMDSKKRSDIRSSAREGAYDVLSERGRPANSLSTDDTGGSVASMSAKMASSASKIGSPPTPIVLNATSTLLHGDCTQMIRKHIADDTVDVVIADVPYFLRQPDADDQSEANRPHPRFKQAWDQYDSVAAYEQFCEGWIDEAMRALDPAGSMFVLGTYHNIGLINRILQIRSIEILGHICWYKRNAVPHLAGRRMASSHETVLWAVKSRDYRFRYRECKSAEYPGDAFKKRGLQMRDVWDIPTDARDGVGHPSPKPVALYDRMLDVAGKPGGVLLDPFAGGGTGAVAAMRWGMRSISIEREDRYIDMIKARVTTARRRIARSAQAPLRRLRDAAD